MKDGFVKVCTVTSDIKVADTVFNTDKIISQMHKMHNQGAKIVLFPELCITGYTCGELFLQNALLKGALSGLKKIIATSENLDAVFTVGLPFMHLSRLYNVAAVICHGQLLGLVPKSFIPSYSQFYEGRYFAAGPEDNITIDIPGIKDEVTFGAKQIFVCADMPDLRLAVEICEDFWMPIPPSSYHAMAGATVLLNPSASDEFTGKNAYRTELVTSQSARTISAYLYASAGGGESTTDLVFSGHNLIAENGTLLVESKRFENEAVLTEVDLQRLTNERRRMTSYPIYQDPEAEGYWIQSFRLNCGQETVLTRKYEKKPFVPDSKKDREMRCNEILNIQSAGLKKRLSHTGCQKAVIGLSGGLDSTLALLVAVRAYDALGLPRENIIGITMPCFGTTDRTYNNAVLLTKELGITLREIRIEEAVNIHFKDIGHDVNVHDITYENGQARERTQILMDVANQENGMVIGTGDMSELALGWATYNGDHMSMYGVNCSVPKTLVRFLVLYYADTCQKEALKKVLYDILDTPVSPELLPPENGEIAQKTEDIVGPYELHDFFLYFIMRFGYMPSKIFRLAVYAFDGKYDKQTIYKWLQTFYRRFFSQQFKRSCLPDGPKVGSVALSPRGDWRMPSDASYALWKADLDKISLS